MMLFRPASDYAYERIFLLNWTKLPISLWKEFITLFHRTVKKNKCIVIKKKMMKLKDTEKTDERDGHIGYSIAHDFGLLIIVNAACNVFFVSEPILSNKTEDRYW